MKLDIDPQRDAKEAREELRQQQEKSDAKIEALTGDLDKTKGDLQKSEITAAMKEMGGQFANALKEMNEKIASVRSGADPAILATQFEALTKVAQQMGFQKSNPQIGDPSIQLEITRLQMESAQKDREFQAKLALENRQWDLEKMKLEDERDFKRAQLAQDAKRNDMIAQAPQMLGTAIGQGLLTKQSSRGGGVAEEALPEPQAPRGKQEHHVEAGWGESGTIECPGCSEPLGIGPTAKVAVCANCNERVPIRRVDKKPVAEEA